MKKINYEIIAINEINTTLSPFCTTLHPWNMCQIVSRLVTVTASIDLLSLSSGSSLVADVTS